MQCKSWANTIQFSSICNAYFWAHAMQIFKHMQCKTRANAKCNIELKCRCNFIMQKMQRQFHQPKCRCNFIIEHVDQYFFFLLEWHLFGQCWNAYLSFLHSKKNYYFIKRGRLIYLLPWPVCSICCWCPDLQWAFGLGKIV